MNHKRPMSRAEHGLVAIACLICGPLLIPIALVLPALLNLVTP